MATPMKARPTEYKGVHMRSRLEAKYAQWLDSIPRVEWEYEPMCYASDEGQYLPDFAIRSVEYRSTSVDVFVELKPTLAHVDPDLMRRNNRIIHANPGELWPVYVLEVRDHPTTFVFQANGATSGAAWRFSQDGRLELVDVFPTPWRDHPPRDRSN